jgi:uncharacterized surface anchored protein
MGSLDIFINLKEKKKASKKEKKATPGTGEELNTRLANLLIFKVFLQITTATRLAL